MTNITKAADIIEDDNYVIHGAESKTPFPKETLGEGFLRACINAPKDSVVMIDAFTHEKLLYSELLQKCVNLAAALRHHGYAGQSTVLSISSENSLDFSIPLWASFLNGSIMAPLNPTYTPYELEHALDISKPQVLFCSAKGADKFLDMKEKLNFLKRIVILGSSSVNPKQSVETMDQFVHTFLRGKDVDPRKFRPADGDISKMAALILNSSGTTGLPKGVTLSHQCLNVVLSNFRNPEFHSQTPHQHVLGLIPFFHSYGIMLTFVNLMRNNTIVCFKKFDEDVFLRSIQDYKINTLPLVPPLAVFLAKTKKIWQYDMSNITDIYCGAAPLNKNIEEEVKRRLKCDRMRQGYGLTETTLTVTLVPTNELRHGSCGKVLPFISIKVRDPETGRSLGPNKIGEICVKGPNVMMGYYHNDQATKDTFTSDGWFKTGDLGYYDEQRYFYVIDRLKELIKYKGYQVAPAELEAILINHPKISDAGVVGLPDELVGERPLAFVVKREGTQICEEEIKKHVAGLVSPQKRLSGGVIFVDSIPKNASGKILRRELRELLKRYAKKTVDSKL